MSLGDKTFEADKGAAIASVETLGRWLVCCLRGGDEEPSVETSLRLNRKTNQELLYLSRHRRQKIYAREKEPDGGSMDTTRETFCSGAQRELDMPLGQSHEKNEVSEMRMFSGLETQSEISLLLDELYGGLWDRSPLD